MAVTLKRLCEEQNNPFKLSVKAGQNSIRNTVTWVHMVEDEFMIPRFHGSELAVTTCIKLSMDPDWLMKLVTSLSECRAAGLVINTGKFIHEIPEEVLCFCDKNEFPLLTMPWEVHITDMIRNFCTRIITEQQDSLIHDKALQDALHKRDNVEEYQEILGRYYKLDGSFIVLLIYIRSSEQDRPVPENIEYQFANRIRRFKTSRGLNGMKIGLVQMEHYQLFVINNMNSSIIPEMRRIIQEVYQPYVQAGSIHIGAGIEVQGLSELSKSYQRAKTAMRMASYQNVPYVHFEDMGVYKILFSVKEDDLLYSYADEVLRELDIYEKKHPGYMELLQAYIRNDRSLERTADELFLHRNTVNYRMQRLRGLLGSPLKTLEDFFPIQMALAIRDMKINAPVQ